MKGSSVPTGASGLALAGRGEWVPRCPGYLSFHFPSHSYDPFSSPPHNPSPRQSPLFKVGGGGCFTKREVPHDRESRGAAEDREGRSSSSVPGPETALSPSLLRDLLPFPARRGGVGDPRPSLPPLPPHLAGQPLPPLRFPPIPPTSHSRVLLPELQLCTPPRPPIRKRF